jgi:hypothetical protein
MWKITWARKVVAPVARRFIPVPDIVWLALREMEA